MYYMSVAPHGKGWVARVEQRVCEVLCHVQEEKRWALVTPSEEQGSIKIAAIDNGLAFPFKHPDEWRTCKTSFSCSQLRAERDFFVCVCVFRSVLLGVAAHGQDPILG